MLTVNYKRCLCLTEHTHKQFMCYSGDKNSMYPASIHHQQPNPSHQMCGNVSTSQITKQDIQLVTRSNSVSGNQSQFRAVLQEDVSCTSTPHTVSYDSQHTSNSCRWENSNKELNRVWQSRKEQDKMRRQLQSSVSHAAQLLKTDSITVCIMYYKLQFGISDPVLSFSVMHSH